MQRHGLPDDRVVEAEAYSEAAGRTALLQLLDDDRPTAVVAGNDLLALGCYDALAESGLSCPDDLSVVGFNDMPFISRLQPPLTSVRVPQYELGRRGRPAAARPAQRPHGDPAGRPAAGAAGRPGVDRSPAGDRAPGPAGRLISRRRPSPSPGRCPRSVSSARAALRPARPDTEPPGCAVAPVW